MPSPAQWAAEGTMHMSVGSAAAMEPFQRMQAASDVAGRSAEADSSAAAVEQPRGGRQGTFRRFGCSTAAQPVALMQPDVRSLDRAVSNLQAQQESYAEAQASML